MQLNTTRNSLNILKVKCWWWLLYSVLSKHNYRMAELASLAPTLCQTQPDTFSPSPTAQRHKRERLNTTWHNFNSTQLFAVYPRLWTSLLDMDGMGYTVGTGVATAQKIVKRPTTFLPRLPPFGSAGLFQETIFPTVTCVQTSSHRPERPELRYPIFATKVFGLTLQCIYK